MTGGRVKRRDRAATDDSDVAGVRVEAKLYLQALGISIAHGWAIRRVVDDALRAYIAHALEADPELRCAVEGFVQVRGRFEAERRAAPPPSARPSSARRVRAKGERAG